MISIVFLVIIASLVTYVNNWCYDKKGIKFTIVLLCCVVVLWKITDFILFKDPEPSISIPQATIVSFYSEGYNCGWNDNFDQKRYSPETAANNLYSTLGNSVYEKISEEYAAAFAAGYGYGYQDYETGVRTNATRYIDMGYDQ